jgi:hypothetical protein
MVFANGPSGQEWGWAAVKAVELQEGDKRVREDQTHINGYEFTSNV